jgi:hypothetical protein
MQLEELTSILDATSRSKETFGQGLTEDSRSALEMELMALVLKWGCATGFVCSLFLRVVIIIGTRPDSCLDRGITKVLL